MDAKCTGQQLFAPAHDNETDGCKILEFFLARNRYLRHSRDHRSHFEDDKSKQTSIRRCITRCDGVVCYALRISRIQRRNQQFHRVGSRCHSQIYHCSNSPISRAHEHLGSKSSTFQNILEYSKVEKQLSLLIIYGIADSRLIYSVEFSAVRWTE